MLQDTQCMRSWRSTGSICTTRPTFPYVRMAGGPPRSRELAETRFFLSPSCQGMTSAVVVLMVTMGSYGALVRFFNNPQTHIYMYVVVRVVQERINTSQ